MIQLRIVFSSFLQLVVVMLGGITALTATAETIAIIGTGEVAGALGPEFAAIGHEIVYGSRNPDRESVNELVGKTGVMASATGQREAAQRGQIVILAVPWNVVGTTLNTLGDLSGKIVVDPTNPRIVGNDGLRDYVSETSNADMIQSPIPEAVVVNAFNKMPWRTLVEPDSTGGPVTVPIVGNDTEAKAVIAALISGIGLEPVDLGPVRYAHVLEGMYYLWGNAAAQGHGFNYYLRPAIAD